MKLNIAQVISFSQSNIGINMIKIITLFFLIIPSIVNAHGGGLDGSGGHNNRKTGGYHCHREPCYNHKSKADRATKKAIKEKREFSYIYSRDDWKHWSDFDADCMNTRHEILKDQADGPIKLSPDGCYVSTGLWDDPFSGKQFTRASDLDVDHIVPLKWANDHGGGSWSKKAKERFANDHINLLAVDDGLNQSKGAKGPDDWMPPNHSFRCDYLSLWVQVLKKYSDLKFKTIENRIFNKQLKHCK
jgi:hypothetical protein